MSRYDSEGARQRASLRTSWRDIILSQLARSGRYDETFGPKFSTWLPA
jgi:hypothetical protein